MSTLTMILAAGMVMGDGPERVTGEVAVEKVTLRLRGEWVVTHPATSSEFTDSGEQFIRLFKVQDEGEGKLQMTLPENIPCVGIYRQERDRVVICFRMVDEFDEKRPTCFKEGDGQHLLILRRVKPRK